MVRARVLSAFARSCCSWLGDKFEQFGYHGAILAALLGLVVSGFSQTTVSLLFAARLAFGQTGGTGSIQGTVTDPSGVLATGAIVSIGIGRVAESQNPGHRPRILLRSNRGAERRPSQERR